MGKLELGLDLVLEIEEEELEETSISGKKMMARRWSSATATSGEAPARVEAPNGEGAMGAPPWRLGEERGRVGKEMDKEREERRLSSG